MAIQTKQKSKGDRTSQARRATDSELGRTAVTPVLLPESAARSQQFKPEELGAADEWLATNSDDQTVKLKMFKRGDKTYVTLVGDVKSLMRDLGTKDLDFLSGLVDQVANASPKASSYLEEHWSQFVGNQAICRRAGNPARACVHQREQAQGSY